MEWIFGIANLIMFIHCIFAWREVRGLQGGFGRGVWAECSTFMMDAKSARKSSTLVLIGFTVLHVLTYFE